MNQVKFNNAYWAALLQLSSNQKIETQKTVITEKLRKTLSHEKAAYMENVDEINTRNRLFQIPYHPIDPNDNDIVDSIQRISCDLSR